MKSKKGPTNKKTIQIPSFMIACPNAILVYHTFQVIAYLNECKLIAFLIGIGTPCSLVSGWQIQGSINYQFCYNYVDSQPNNDIRTEKPPF